MAKGFVNKLGVPTLVSADTRRQAIRDGLLVDVSNVAEKVGIVFATAMTKAAYDRFVRLPDGQSGGYDYRRLWDILWTLRDTISAAPNAQGILLTFFLRNDKGLPYPAKLKALWGEDDAGGLFLTVMLPNEH